MARSKKFTWLISPKNFIQLIGAEYDILKKSGSVSLLKFYIAAIAILGILIISSCSILYAMELLFHMLYIELTLAVFLSVLFVFIYIFLLNTFSKNIFKPGENHEPKIWYRRIRLSDVIRTGFVALMAFLISKPMEVFIFQNKLKTKVQAHRAEILNAYNQKLERLYNKDLVQLQNLINFYDKQIAAYPSSTLINQKTELSKRIAAITNKRMAEMKAARIRVEVSDFLLFRIKEVSKSAPSWLICGCMICLFLLPGYLIYSISSADEYYKLKREYEESMVLEEYHAFEVFYTTIFRQIYQVDRAWYTNFEDPPFNTKQKIKAAYQPQTAFFKKYSSD